ncbi:uncharacterized protein L3040_009263 [Drepanopeziza brunnea f. sp. 'multigermtubi']|uniref:Restriction of telomere capping protein 4 n=1 Tax=Marssonina brunnea f. sp. multigermtubi (strain MB_m1) TaxID=1072389 RepID=K1X2Q6_MARBU|nr:uncharacterized protein MBM_02534 [Drepanopeziza brunnea f. sp. 'multigermtubi' MB_m1]EKD19297.1 hypothetical protein MBM_02534 [Drepanopeziza brunnea f. sp. 'multigermtubi' MB_m1]KAJ5032668.1 hypothetical protein L3040_009263 [Drepanopeziza brunnea f. sp. 'multigermtubi']
MSRPSDVNILHLGNGQWNRRTGMNRADFKYQSLHQNIATPTQSPSPSNMPPSATTKCPTDAQKSAVKEEAKDDVTRPPDSSSDEEENSADIRRTNFTTRQEESELAEPSPSTAREVKTGNDVYSNKENRTTMQRSQRSQRNQNLISNSSSPSVVSTGSVKRKMEEGKLKLGAGMTDALGFTKVAAKRPKYGDKAKKPMKSSNPKIFVSKSKAAALKKYIVDDSPEKPRIGMKTYGLSRSPSLESEDGKRSLPSATDEVIKPGFIRSRWEVEDSDGPDHETGKPLVSRGLKQPLMYNSPEKPKGAFKSLNIGQHSDIVSKAKDLVDQHRDIFDPLSEDDNDFLTMTQQARCPMCNAHVSPDTIREFTKAGRMNIRTQEKFCRAHRVKSAEDDWALQGYPEIDWDKLDSRISKHHSFIKKLINGQESHYRDLLGEKVESGKDRNLMKMTSNLTPGYYGARGLRAISENIFHKFTPLLKKRMIQDPLMSARGYTAYVQTVLVPEATVLLIQEDMSVDAEKAREILSDSVEVGELLNEEIEDIVRKKVFDSAGSGDSGE